MKRGVKKLSLPVGSILLSQMEYVIEVLMKFEPSLQLKTRTTPGNQESFVSTPAHLSHDQAVQEYLQSLHTLAVDDIIEVDKVKTTSPKLHYNSDQCQYLRHTLGYALRYVPIPPTSKQKLLVLGDASFAPTGEKSQQGIVCCLSWYHLQSTGWW